jgi:aspartate ammonia-lyase
MIESGKKTSKEIISIVSSKALLTEDQINEILSWGSANESV